MLDITGQLAVTVNTKHPHIAHLLQTQLAQGMAALKEGKNFAVEVKHLFH